VDADHAKFTGLLYNGFDVDPSSYTTASGSTVITLKESYLKTFADGTHWFVARFSDGKSERIRLVVNTGAGNPGGGTATPQTGDGADLWLWMIALLTSALGALCLLVWMKRHPPEMQRSGEGPVKTDGGAAGMRQRFAHRKQSK
jgi:hypothetical protein